MKAKKPLLLFVLTLVLLALALVLPAVASAGGINFYIPTARGSSDPDAPDAYNDRIRDGFYDDGIIIWGGYGRLPSASPSVGDQVFLRCGWAGYGKGRIQTAPNYMIISMEVWKQTGGAHEGDPDLTITPEQAKAYWGQAMVKEPDGSPFNPNIGAKLYVIYWDVELTPLAAGDYTVHFTFDFKHPTTDLGWYPEFFPDGQHKPYKILPGSGGDSWFWFTITG